MIFGPVNAVLTSLRQHSLAKKINPQDTTYNESPYAKEMLGLARMRMNSQMPGTASMNRQVQQQAANTNATVQRGASSGNQVLQGAFAAQEMANDANTNLLGMQNQYDQQNMGNLEHAQQVMVNEGDKVYQDKVRRFMQDFQTKWALQNASWSNRAQGLNALDSNIASIAGSMLGGGIPIGQLFGTPSQAPTQKKKE